MNPALSAHFASRVVLKYWAHTKMSITTGEVCSPAPINTSISSVLLLFIFLNIFEKI
jgi:hypothetical protein